MAHIDTVLLQETHYLYLQESHIDLKSSETSWLYGLSFMGLKVEKRHWNRAISPLLPTE